MNRPLATVEVAGGGAMAWMLSLLFCGTAGLPWAEIEELGFMALALPIDLPPHFAQRLCSEADEPPDCASSAKLPARPERRGWYR